MRKVLILVLSTEKDFYGRLAETSRETWDSQDVEGVETIFYFAANPDKEGNYKTLYTKSDDDFFSMGKKTLCAFEYALANREFDYIFRANASLYVHKPGLLRYVQNQPETGLALGVVADCGHFGGERFSYLWGPSYLLSRDVVADVVKCKDLWNHKMMDDNAISCVLHALGIPLDNRGSMASVAHNERGYEFVYYENGVSGGATLQSLDTLREQLPNQWCFRVKCDADRSQDLRLMRELFDTFSK